MIKTPMITKPQITNIEIYHLLMDSYRLMGSLKQLPGERDHNFLLETNTGDCFVLKIFNAGENKDFITAQHEIWRHLASANLSCPKLTKNVQGNEITEIGGKDKSRFWVRLTNYLPGDTLAGVKKRSKGLLYNIGAFLGRMDLLLEQIDQPAVHREFHWDLANGPIIINKHLHLVESPETRARIRGFLRVYKKKAAPILSRIRKSIIHNDANDYNLVVGNTTNSDGQIDQKVVGIIDFGDMVYSYTLAEIAVAITYLILDSDEPLETAAVIVQGYHQENPLSADELSAIYYLICMRLCMSICLAAYQMSENPDNQYLTISQPAIEKTLPEWLDIVPEFAEAVFRRACNLHPHPKTLRIALFLSENQDKLSPVFGVQLNEENCQRLDLGVNSPHIRIQKDSSKQVVQQIKLSQRIHLETVKYFIGNYGEARLSAIPAIRQFHPLPLGNDPTVHLGIDVFTEPGEPIYCPIDGWVFKYLPGNHQTKRPPILTIRHLTENQNEFFIQYRNIEIYSLSSSVENSPIQKGKFIEKGSLLGRFRKDDLVDENLSYLHLQIITDFLGCSSEFPAFVVEKDSAIWLAFCPDPGPLLRIPENTALAPKPTKAITLSNRRHWMGRNLSLAYTNPLKIERGWMQYLFDEMGCRYLDGYNNVPHVGHCHPEVVEAGCSQMHIINSNTRYLHDLTNEYAAKLLETVPDPLKVCFFVNSGSEANELALRLSRAHTGQKDMIVLDGAYHGNTTTMIDISPYKFNGPGGMGPADWVHTVPVADVYRGQHKVDDPDKALKYAHYVEDAISQLIESRRGLCGFIAETCPSVAGQIILPRGYLKLVYQFIRSAGGVCIADEVQTGYGRLGTHFYGFEAHDVVPDILVLGKPIGNGHPIGAVITSEEIAHSFDNGMEFFSTFGGNHVSCAIGIKVLEIVKRENLQNHALEVGDHLLSGLRDLQNRFALLGDVRGSGLFIGVELVRNPVTLEPAVTEARSIVNALREKGVLIGTDGIYHNVLKIRPPMPFSFDDSNFLLEKLKRVLQSEFST